MRFYLLRESLVVVAILIIIIIIIIIIIMIILVVLPGLWVYFNWPNFRAMYFR